MYSLQKAAEILGRSESTVRTWMKRCGIEVVPVETDRRRVYIADSDMDRLVDLIVEKTLKKDNKAGRYGGKNKNVIITGEGKYYSFAGAAPLLGVTALTVKKWSKQDKIETKLITTDTTRAYILHDDVLRLAELHGRKISSKVLAETDVQREVNDAEPDMDKLCSLKEATLYLDVPYRTLLEWLKQTNIERKMKHTDRVRAYIAYRDVVRLAELHRREIVPNPSSLTVEEEIKEIRDELAKLAADIEAIKHDFRVYVKRSIYIG